MTRSSKSRPEKRTERTAVPKIATTHDIRRTKKGALDAGAVPGPKLRPAEHADKPKRSVRPTLTLLPPEPVTNDSEPAPEAPAAPVEALVDGKRVVIDAQDEIVLRCGKASITLRRNGRIVIRGTYVETRAEGVNRIKGGSVQIN